MSPFLKNLESIGVDIKARGWQNTPRAVMMDPKQSYTISILLSEGRYLLTVAGLGENVNVWVLQDNGREGGDLIIRETFRYAGADRSRDTLREFVMTRLFEKLLREAF